MGHEILDRLLRIGGKADAVSPEFEVQSIGLFFRVEARMFG